jgi:hypothetical protein
MPGWIDAEMTVGVVSSGMRRGGSVGERDGSEGLGAGDGVSGGSGCRKEDVHESPGKRRIHSDSLILTLRLIRAGTQGV